MPASVPLKKIPASRICHKNNFSLALFICPSLGTDRLLFRLPRLECVSTDGLITAGPDANMGLSGGCGCMSRRSDTAHLLIPITSTSALSFPISNLSRKLTTSLIDKTIKVNHLETRPVHRLFENQDASHRRASINLVLKDPDHTKERTDSEAECVLNY